MQKTYGHSVFTVKSATDDLRIIEGIATTPTTDRVGDIVETAGIEFKLPLPLLYQHDGSDPIGQVTEAAVKSDGIYVKAKVLAAGLDADVDKAWLKIKNGLVRGLSIGFRILEYSRMDGGGWRILKSEWLELSAVTVPANPMAMITSVKRVSDTAALSSITVQSTDGSAGAHQSQPAGVAANPRKQAMTKAELIKQFEAKILSNSARMDVIMEKAGGENRTMDEAESQEYDDLQSENQALQRDLKRYREAEQAMIQRAQPVNAAAAGAQGTNGGDPAATGSAMRGGVVTVKSPLPLGTAFTRYVMALATTRGAKWEAAEYAKKWKDSSPEVELILRAAVAAGTTTNPDWSSLVVYQNIASEFVELLRPLTIIGRLATLRRVPFNITIPTQTSSTTVTWVGQQSPKPVGTPKFSQISLGMSKIAGIVVISEELARASSPSAEAVVRSDMLAQISTFMDTQFVDPTIAAIANVRPASVTNGVTPIIASGTNAAAVFTDLEKLLGTFATNNYDPSSLTLLMSSKLAINLSTMMTSLGVPQFPGMTPSGGTLMGLPVIASQNVMDNPGSGSPIVGDGGRIIAISAGDVLLADDGGVQVDVSREASLQMDSAPTDPPTASTVFISLWQENLVGIRAERFINWLKRRSTAVQYIDQAKYA